MTNDIYSSYENALRSLLHQMGYGHPRYAEALLFEHRLRENIAHSRHFGDTSARNADRAEIVVRLNELTLSVLGVSFNHLCNSSVDEYLSPPTATNPFGQTGRITDPDLFFGHDDLLRRIFEELARGISLSLIGKRQSGKSSILSMICELGPNRLKLPQEAFIYLNMQTIDDENDFFEALCAEMNMPPMRGGKLARALRGKHFIICLDEIEKMINTASFKGVEREQLRGLADGAAAPLTLVIASNTPLEHLFPDSPEMTSPLANVCRTLDIPPFDDSVARYFLLKRLQGTGIAFSEADIQHLIAQSNGSPAHLQQAAARLFERYREQGSQ